jgi:hypothetical protein
MLGHNWLDFGWTMVTACGSHAQQDSGERQGNEDNDHRNDDCIAYESTVHALASGCHQVFLQGPYVSCKPFDLPYGAPSPGLLPASANGHAHPTLFTNPPR